MENQALEEIAAAIAHEVKNPLTLVSFNLDILESSDERLETHKNYAMIRKELKKINDIIMDFIYLTGNYSDEKDTVYIVNILNEFKEDLAVSIPDINVSITYDCKNMAIYGYESGIRTIFGNIIKNAAEAMNFAGELQIKAGKIENRINISFKDSGTGLDEKVRDKIFKEQFTTKPMGSGLGLSICKKIAGEHNGDFTLVESPDGGCVAIVELPVVND
ncbi:MAG: HAMP domain-containing histidine kinase [Defluviitaleaceae bacterium]|nr:HAMP domain-containing histidine kinase [Defluviitaleaceae bacterium]